MAVHTRAQTKPTQQRKMKKYTEVGDYTRDRDLVIKTDTDTEYESEIEAPKNAGKSREKRVGKLTTNEPPRGRKRKLDDNANPVEKRRKVEKRAKLTKPLRMSKKRKEVLKRAEERKAREMVYMSDDDDVIDFETVVKFEFIE